MLTREPETYLHLSVAKNLAMQLICVRGLSARVCVCVCEGVCVCVCVCLSVCPLTCYDDSITFPTAKLLQSIISACKFFSLRPGPFVPCMFYPNFLQNSYFHGFRRWKVISLRTGNSLERNIMQFFGRDFLTSSYMFDKFIVCHHLEMKAVASLDRSPLHFPKAVEPSFYKMICSCGTTHRIFIGCIALCRSPPSEFFLIFHVQCVV